MMNSRIARGLLAALVLVVAVITIDAMLDTKVVPVPSLPQIVPPALAPFQAMRGPIGQSILPSEDNPEFMAARGESIARLLPALASYVETSLEAALPKRESAPGPGSVSNRAPSLDLGLVRLAVKTTLELAAHRASIGATGNAEIAMRLRLAALRIALALCRGEFQHPSWRVYQVAGGEMVKLATSEIVEGIRGASSSGERPLREVAAELLRLSQLHPTLSAVFADEREGARAHAAVFRDDPEELRSTIAFWGASAPELGLPSDFAVLARVRRVLVLGGVSFDRRVADFLEAESVAFWNDAISQVEGAPYIAVEPKLRFIDDRTRDEGRSPGLAADLLSPVGTTTRLLFAIGAGHLREFAVTHFQSVARVRGAALFARLEIRRRETKAWPRTLEDLGKDLPPDPFTGRPFLYSLDDHGGMRLAAAGENGRDDRVASDGGDDVVIAQNP